MSQGALVSESVVRLCSSDARIGRAGDIAYG